MGQNQDFSAEEIDFLVEHFRKGWGNKDILEEMQEKTGLPPRKLRSVIKIRRIYEAVKKAYEQEVYEDARAKLESILHKMAAEAIKAKRPLDIHQVIEVVEHMTKGDMPIPDEKTGEIRYMPSDF